MKLLHPVNDRKIVGFSETERNEAKRAICCNVVLSMAQVRFFTDRFYNLKSEGFPIVGRLEGQPLFVDDILQDFCKLLGLRSIL